MKHWKTSITYGHSWNSNQERTLTTTNQPEICDRYRLPLFRGVFWKSEALWMVIKETTIDFMYKPPAVNNSG